MPKKQSKKDILRDFDPRIGYVYDIRMKYHRNLDDSEDPHPEDPRRTYWIHSLFDRADMLSIMHSVRFEPVTNDQILRVHKSSHLAFLQKTELMEQTVLVNEQEKYDSVYFCSESFYCAKLSAGGLLSLCKEVVGGRLDGGFAIVRPPGHHACRSKAMGFCLLNNVAITVEDLLASKLVQKVMIVDWDIHHGNGIQDAFIRNPNVLYCSLHRYDGGEFYPSGTEGNMDKVGKDAGRGFNINIPWAAGGVGDGDYLYAFRNIVIPVAHEFAPDLIIVASGFDAAACDPIGECFVTPEGYACMTSMLRGVGNGRLVLSLEGGYNLDAIANSALGCVKALLGIRWKAGVTPECAAYNAYATLSIAEVNGVPMGNPTYSEAWKALPDWDPAFEVPNCFHSSPTPMGRDVVDEVVRVHSQFWSCLNKQP